MYTRFSERYVGLNSLKRAFIDYMLSVFGKVPYEFNNEGIRMFDYEKEMFYMVEIKGKRRKNDYVSFNYRFQGFLNDSMDLKDSIRFSRKNNIGPFDEDIWFHYSLYGMDVFLLKILAVGLEAYEDRVILCNNKEMLKKMYDEVYWEATGL